MQRTFELPANTDLGVPIGSLSTFAGAVYQVTVHQLSTPVVVESYLVVAANLFNDVVDDISIKIAGGTTDVIVAADEQDGNAFISLKNTGLVNDARVIVNEMNLQKLEVTA